MLRNDRWFQLFFYFTAEREKLPPERDESFQHFYFFFYYFRNIKRTELIFFSGAQVLWNALKSIIINRCQMNNTKARTTTTTMYKSICFGGTSGLVRSGFLYNKPFIPRAFQRAASVSCYATFWFKKIDLHLVVSFDISRCLVYSSYSFTVKFC